jgi:hypothetical protein
MKNKLAISCLALMVFFASCDDLINSENTKYIYPASKFVAVASGSGWTAYSEDGKTWTRGGNLPAELQEGGLRDPVSWSSVAYGRGKFAAVSTADTKAALSTDGVTWTETELPSTLAWPEIVYGNGIFAAVGNSSAAYYEDGEEWQPASLPSGQWGSVAYGNGQFMAIDQGAGKKAAVSADGSVWQDLPETLPTGSWFSVVYGSGKFVAFSNNGAIAYSSIDRDSTLVWTQKSGAVPSGSSKAVYGGRKFVAVFGVTSSSNKAAYSADGINWTEAELPASAQWNSIAYGDGIFVALASGTAAWSEDGVDWTAAELPQLQEGATWAALAFMEGY